MSSCDVSFSTSCRRASFVSDTAASLPTVNGSPRCCVAASCSRPPHHHHSLRPQLRSSARSAQSPCSSSNGSQLGNYSLCHPPLRRPSPISIAPDMTDTAINPVAPCRAHARNASSRSLAPKPPQNRPVSAPELSRPVVMSQPLLLSRPCRTQENTLPEPGSAIQIP